QGQPPDRGQQTRLERLIQCGLGWVPLVPPLVRGARCAAEVACPLTAHISSPKLRVVDVTDEGIWLRRRRVTLSVSPTHRAPMSSSFAAFSRSASSGPGSVD